MAYVRDFEAEITSGGQVLGQRDKVKPEFKSVKIKGVDTDVCYFHIPGDKLQCHAKVVDDTIKRRFPAAWLAYSDGDIAPVNGTPINQLPSFPSRLALELKATGLTSIEDLADLDDLGCKTFMGGITWRKKAQMFLAAKPTPDNNKITALEEQVAKLTAMVNGKANAEAPAPSVSVIIDPPKKPGRPRKVSAA
jgi:hypothetical protein